MFFTEGSGVPELYSYFELDVMDDINKLCHF